MGEIIDRRINRKQDGEYCGCTHDHCFKALNEDVDGSL